jgi:uncharacterized repeat protein (TIGR04076 family)
MLDIKVRRIKGICPVYKVGKRMIIYGPKILLNKTDTVCVHALSALLHYVVALENGANSVIVNSHLPLNFNVDSAHIASLN